MLENVQEILNDFKANVIREAKKNLSAQSTSGKLKNSLKGYVKESKNSIQVSFEMEEYGFFQDRGVKGKKSGKSLDGYKYTNKMPPPKAFDKWTVRKGIAPRDKEGMLPNSKPASSRLPTASAKRSTAYAGDLRIDIRLICAAVFLHQAKIRYAPRQ